MSNAVGRLLGSLVSSRPLSLQFFPRLISYSFLFCLFLSPGFYYMSNAVGRLFGTLVSGALYEFIDRQNHRVGFGACFWFSAGAVLIAAVSPLLIPGDMEGGLNCGACVAVRGREERDRPATQGGVAAAGAAAEGE
jgi:hypothetical protein